jgi:hypothetical protein
VAFAFPVGLLDYPYASFEGVIKLGLPCLKCEILSEISYDHYHRSKMHPVRPSLALVAVAWHFVNSVMTELDTGKLERIFNKGFLLLFNGFAFFIMPCVLLYHSKNLTHGQFKAYIRSTLLFDFHICIIEGTNFLL